MKSVSAITISLLLAVAVTPGLAQAKKGAKIAKPSVKTSKSTSGPAFADSILDGIFHNIVEVSDDHYHEGEYNHIVNLGRMTIAARPDDLETVANCGWLLWSMDRDEEAVALYKDAAQRNPLRWEAYDELGMYYSLRKKDWKTAIVYYEKATSCKGFPPTTIHSLARAYEKIGDLTKARNQWKRAVSWPDNPLLGAAKHNLARVENLLKKK